MSPSASEWDAKAYHRVSDPQFRWGLKVLERLSLRGDERVIDAGCGSGRLTAELLQRLPNGHVLAVDASENMLEQARGNLAERFKGRVSFLKADLASLRVDAPYDVVFSTATFHWVLDHDALFRSLAGALKSGGRLHAQCGGGDNVKRIRMRSEAITSEPKFSRYFQGYAHPTLYAWPEETRERLSRAGFGSLNVALEEALTVMPDEASYRAFLETVLLRIPLQRIPDKALQAEFLGRMVAEGRGDSPPFSLDYWRLNMEAVRS
ncbi:MAG: class I SAM-dependent methyltransferase [Myxococcaceae bacterium]